MISPYRDPKPTPIELIEHYEQRIQDFAKFKGPVVEDMIRHLRRRIEWLRAMHVTPPASVPAKGVDPS